jgi:2-polyprenyl-3-methyl-5-hydroxy-6-metoxy-1,4-benzoquinol methylase
MGARIRTRRRSRGAIPVVALSRQNGGHPAGYHAGHRPDIVRLIPGECVRILDVGCGEGALGKEVLRSRPSAEMYGMEIDEDAAALAAQSYREVAVGDVEATGLSLRPGSLDCLIYADVLEHFVAPGDVLRAHLPLLRPGGWVVASVPNVRNVRVLRRLVLRGRWDYFEAGICDWTHLRFWTARTFAEFLEWHGLVIVHRESPPYSRLSKALRIASFGLLRDFLSVKNYFVARLPEAEVRGTIPESRA